MAEANNQDTVKETQNPDLDKSPLASALFRHLEKYYHPKQKEDLYEDGIEIAGFHNG